MKIQPSGYYDQENGGTIPIFTPTMEEFKDFKVFMEAIDEYGKKAGIVKIVPPKEWSEQLPGLIADKINDIKIRRPITQHILGNNGIFSQTNVEKRGTFTVNQWFELCQQPDHRPPTKKQKDSELLSNYLKNETNTSFLTTDQYKDIERYYWRTIAFNQAMYGADLLGTFFDDSIHCWNLNKLDNVLNNLKTVVPGVNSPYLYFGMWKATFAWHLEDMDLYSINLIHFGAPKQWYVIPPDYRKKFENFMQGQFYIQYKHCHQFLRHKTFIISPTILKEQGIPIQRCVQQPGEIIVTFPYGYHSGYNLDFNCAESVNFALDSWVPIGKKAKACNCIEDTVMIDVDEIAPKQESKPQQEEHLKTGIKTKCVLCPVEKPSFVSKDDDYCLMPFSQGAYVHKLCAEAMDETYIAKDRVYGVDDIPPIRKKLICIYCKKKSGACMQCCYDKCSRSFHATCAMESGATMKRKAGRGSASKRSLYDAHCSQHDPKKVEDRQYIKEMANKLKRDLEIYTKWKDGVCKGRIQKCIPKQKVCKVLLQNGTIKRVYWRDIQLSPP
ncbi:JmjC domain, hydroxylase-domain-containing protein [Rhizopus microsporus]